MASADASPLCRVATFNIENFGHQGRRAEVADGGAGLEERIEILRPQLQRLAADILCLQEVDSQHTGPGRERTLDDLDRLLADTPYAGYHRLTSVSRRTGRPRDKHNLLILSRWPFARQQQVFHDLVAPPSHRLATAETGTEATAPIEWDRPFLYAAIDVPGGGRLHLINVHLRAPRAAYVAGQKSDSLTWRSMAAWAEGFFLAAVKRAGQALEVRLFVDRLFDADPAALILVGGDFNAEVGAVPVRTIRGDEEDAGNPHLATRTLVPLERSLADSRRFSIVHHGRPQMLDHLLVSRPLLAWYRSLEIHNEALGDELISAHAVRGSPESYHAPVVAEFVFR